MISPPVTPQHWCDPYQSERMKDLGFWGQSHNPLYPADCESDSSAEGGAEERFEGAGGALTSLTASVGVFLVGSSDTVAARSRSPQVG